MSLQYNSSYWIAALVEVGRKIEPDKYTEQHIKRIYSYWNAQPITNLVPIVNQRRYQLQAQQYNKYEAQD